MKKFGVCLLTYENEYFCRQIAICTNEETSKPYD